MPVSQKWSWWKHESCIQDIDIPDEIADDEIEINQDT